MKTLHIAEENIFTARSDTDTVYLKAGVGETLYIEGDITGYSGGIITYGLSGNLGLNSLVNQKELFDNRTDEVQNQGYSIGLAENYQLACTAGWYITEVSPTGGVIPWLNINTTPTAYSTILDASSVTFTGTLGKYSDMDEDGGIVLTDNGEIQQTVSYYRYDNDLNDWSLDTTEFGFDVVGSIALTTDYVLTCTALGQLIVYYSGGSLAVQQYIDTGLTSKSENIDISGNTLVYEKSGSVYIWTRVGTTWSLLQSFIFSGLVSLNLRQNKLIVSNSSNTNVYVRIGNDPSTLFNFIHTVSGTNNTSCCINDSYFFVSNTTDISVYEYTNTSYTLQGSTTQVNKIKVMKCNDNYLMLGRPTEYGGLGNALLYDITTFVNTIIVKNQIDASVDRQMTIKSTGGEVIIDSEALVLKGDFKFDSSATNKQILANRGDEYIPSYAFNNDPDTGFFSKGTSQIGITLGQQYCGRLRSSGAKSLVIEGAQSSVPNDNGGTVFIQSGIKNGTGSNGNIEMYIANVKVSEINGVNNYMYMNYPILGGTTTAASPAFSFQQDTSYGMYFSTNALNFSTNGTRAGYFDGSNNFYVLNNFRATNNTYCNRTLNGDGLVSQPGYGFENDPNTGMWRFGTDALGFTAGSINVFSVTTSGPSFIGQLSSFHSDTQASPSYTFSANNSTGFYYNDGYNGAVSTTHNNFTVCSVEGQYGISVFASTDAGPTGNIYMYYYDKDGNVVGSISTNGVTTFFNTTSDRRLKQDITTLDYACDIIDNLQPRKFKWKNKLTDDVGFIADELQQVIPSAVTGTINGTKVVSKRRKLETEVEENGFIVPEYEDYTEEEPDYQQIDMSKIVPYLVACLKDTRAELKNAKAEIASLTARVSALESV